MSLQTRISSLVSAISSVINDLRANKVDKIAGKGLSTNDYTNADKAVVDITSTINQYSGYSTVLTGGNMTLTGGINFSVSAGTGLVRNNLGKLVEISWSTLSGTVPQPGDNFVFIDYLGNLVFNTTKESNENIFVGYIVTDITNTSVMGFNTIKLDYNSYLHHISQFTENVLNVLVENGVEFTLQTAPNTLNIHVSAGTLWAVYNKVSFPEKTTFRKFYKDSGANYLEETTTLANTIDVQNWNDVSLSGTNAIKPMTPGYYKKDSFFVSTRGNVFYEYGMAEYQHYDDALIAPPTNSKSNFN